MDGYVCVEWGRVRGGVRGGGQGTVWQTQASGQLPAAHPQPALSQPPGVSCNGVSCQRPHRGGAPTHCQVGKVEQPGQAVAGGRAREHLVPQPLLKVVWQGQQEEAQAGQRGHTPPHVRPRCRGGPCQADGRDCRQGCGGGEGSGTRRQCRASVEDGWVNGGVLVACDGVRTGAQQRLGSSRALPLCSTGKLTATGLAWPSSLVRSAANPSCRAPDPPTAAGNRSLAAAPARLCKLWWASSGDASALFAEVMHHSASARAENSRSSAAAFEAAAAGGRWRRTCCAELGVSSGLLKSSERVIAALATWAMHREAPCNRPQ